MKFKQALSASAIAFILIVLAGVTWKEFFHYQMFPKRFGVVEEGLIYRSGQLHPALVARVLTEHHIRNVVDLQYFEDKPAILAEKVAVDALGIHQFRFPLNGNGTGDIESYVQAIREIDASVKQGDAVLVHCSAGAQRTGGVIASYRTLVQGKSASSAVAEMPLYDWDPVSDLVLLDYLNDNIGVLASRLVEVGVLTAIPDPLPHFEPPNG